MSHTPVTLAQLLIRSMNWAEFELMAGPAHGFGERLAAFVSPDATAARGELWQAMENKVFAQDDVFSAAEPTIRVLHAALAEPLPAGVRNAVLDLLFHLVHAASFRSDDLGRRCMVAAAEGGWLWFVRHWLVTPVSGIPALKSSTSARPIALALRSAYVRPDSRAGGW